MGRPTKDSQGQNRTGEISPSGIVGGLTETLRSLGVGLRPVGKLMAEPPNPTVVHAPYFYPDPKGCRCVRRGEECQISLALVGSNGYLKPCHPESSRDDCNAETRNTASWLRPKPPNEFVTASNTTRLAPASVPSMFRVMPTPSGRRMAFPAPAWSGAFIGGRDVNHRRPFNIPGTPRSDNTTRRSRQDGTADQHIGGALHRQSNGLTTQTPN